MSSDVKATEYDIKIYRINIKDSTYQGKVTIKFETPKDTEALETIPFNINPQKVEIQDIKLHSRFTKTESEVPIKNLQEPSGGTGTQATVTLEEKVPSGVKENYLTVYFKGQIYDASANGKTEGVYKVVSVTDKTPGTVLGADFSKDVNAIPNIDSLGGSVDISLAISVPNDWQIRSNGEIVDSKALASDGKKGAEYLLEKPGGDEVSELKEVKFEKINLKLNDLTWTALIK